MRTQWNRERVQTAFVLLCGLLITFCLQIVKFDIFPQKYFYDAGVVQTLMQQLPPIRLHDSYGVTAWVFHLFDQLLPMDSQLAGGLSVWVLVIFPCGCLAARYMRAVWSDYILFALYCVLLPVFVWNTQKEAVQFFFFFVVALCAIKGKNCRCTKAALILLLLLWGLVFRTYYLIIAAGTAALMLLYAFPWEKTEKRQARILLFVLFLGAIVILVAIKGLYPQLLSRVFGSRTVVNMARIDSSDAKTILIDVFENKEGSIILYLVNYGIAAVRMLFPFELIFKGIHYLPFIALQLFWDALLLHQIIGTIQCRKNGTSDFVQTRLMSIMVSWYLVSFLFEPDFGSFVRHQSAAFPIMFPLFTVKDAGEIL